jgi:hypothetical protein
MTETLLSPSNILIFGRIVEDLQVVAPTTGRPGDSRHGPFSQTRLGIPSQIEQQLLSGTTGSGSHPNRPFFARIYGFSFEGTYCDLPRPTFFLVHGPGTQANEVRGVNRARSPAEPSVSGLGSADFDFADDIMVWSYDMADYTIRMDVETGMFEQVLLDAMVAVPDASGMNARGMNARGGRNARGMNARGGRNARGGGNSD